jgi:uncharacterized protein YjbI with pentapeptide repeats
MLIPQRAVVRPRAIAPHCGESLPLEDLVLAFLEERQQEGSEAGTIIQIGGGAGAGKSTALAHLAAVLPEAEGMAFLDNESPESAICRKLRGETVIMAFEDEVRSEADACFELAPWTQDDLLEYLLAAHPRECGALLARIRLAGDGAPLQGNPELWRCVLEELAAEPALPSARGALEQALGRVFERSDDRWYAEECCVAKLAGDLDRWLTLTGKLTREIPPDEFGLLRHQYPQLLLAATGLVDRLWTEHGEQMLHYRLPAELIRLAAPKIAASELLVHKLKSLLYQRHEKLHSTVASLLVAAGSDWMPEGAEPLNLQRGYFSGVQWPSVIFPRNGPIRTNLCDADFSGADLCGADLTGAIAISTCFWQARLSTANMVSLDASFADFSEANLSGVRGERLVLCSANLQGAVLAEASLQGANFTEANLDGAGFVAADLAFAILNDASIDETNFEGADLSSAALCLLPLYKANLAGARFQGALMQKCDLEGIELSQACFERANLSGAYLTGSTMPRGDFRGANLKGAGLADIEWEQADLRGADLRGCTFHMGSTRCGLVGSPYALEGSRTGFYTDDYHDQTYKRPEEIRKANLRGADLRGARLDGVDFYLVDLREARIDAKYKEHLLSCRAILENRCPE